LETIKDGFKEVKSDFFQNVFRHQKGMKKLLSWLKSLPGYGNLVIINYDFMNFMDLYGCFLK